MAKYAINDEGVAALQQLETDLRQFCDDLEDTRTKLEKEVLTNESGLGEYFVELMNLIDDLGMIQHKGQGALMELAEKVHRIKGKVEELLARGLKKK